MKTLIALPLCVLALTGCAYEPYSVPSDVAPVRDARTLKSGIILENFDQTVRPGDDFSAYVNGTWIRNTEIPADKATYGASFIVHEKSQDDVRKIIEDAAAGNHPVGSDEQKVGDLFHSYMDMTTRDRLGMSPLQEDLARIDAIDNHRELSSYFAYANKVGFNPPFGLLIYPDLKDPQHYAMYVWQGGLGLPDREYYFNEDEKSRETRAGYRAHTASMLRMSGIGGGPQAVDTIMALETRIAGEHMKKEDTRDIPKLYNKYLLAELPKLMPDFAWDAYLEEASLADAPHLIVAMKDYTGALNEIFRSTDIDTWKIYLKWKALNASAARLDSDIDAQNFEFYGKTLTGAQEQRPRWRRAVSAVNGTVGEVVGKVYVKRHFPSEAKERMLEMVGNLLDAYKVSINELDWMGAETKVQALDKLSKFTAKIGYPDIWKDYSALVVERADLFGNLRRSALVEYARDIEKYSGPVQKHEWNMTPQTVNAYYSPAQNEIVFPAAILQPPFFDMSADDAVNYGAIGGVIGHEIGHGFDDAGSTFDGDGVLRDWWTDADKAEFKKRTEALIAQYDEFQVFDDLNVNGTFTLGENIGDLGGLSIGLRAYRMSLEGSEAPVLDGFTGEQRVFIGWAQSWLKKERDEALRQQINTDPHSPARFRINGVVRNVPEFYSSFGVDLGDALYLSPSERVKIW